MVALITGALGHIGRWVTQRLLEQGADVVAVDLRPSDAGLPSAMRPFLASGQLRYAPADVLDVAAIGELFAPGQIDGVIHVAGISGVPGFGREPRRSLELNLMGTINLLDAARKHGARRFVYVSSGAVYGEREGTLSEDDACHPADLYGVSKLAGEQIALSFGATHELDVTCARVFFVYGPGSHPADIWMPAELIFGPLHDLPGATALTGADQVLDFTHVFDAAAGIALLYRAGKLPADTYNISSGAAYTVAQAVALVADVVGRDTGVRVGPGKSARRGSPLDITRAARDVGYHPRFTNLRDGITHYYEWLRDHDEELQWTTGQTPTGKNG